MHRIHISFTLITTTNSIQCIPHNTHSIHKISSITHNTSIINFNIYPILHNYQQPTKIKTILITHFYTTTTINNKNLINVKPLIHQNINKLNKTQP